MASTPPTVSDVLAAFVDRLAFLNCLRDGPSTAPVLADELDVARSTVDRATNTLETVDLIEQTDGEYCTTSMGQRVTADFFDLAAAVDETRQDHAHGPDDVPVLAVLATGTRRLELLDRLLDDPADKRALVETLGLSRATVDRRMRELETLGLVRYTDGCFTVTPTGELTASGLSDLTETITLRQQLDPFLQGVPAGTLDIDLQLLADAELFVAEPGDPWAMVNRHVQMLKDMTTLRCVLPLTGLHALEILHDRIVHDGARCETVVEPQVADTFRSSPDYADRVEDMLATDRFDLFVYEGNIPYFLGMFAERVQIGVDEDNQPRALLETDAPAVRAWAERTYDEYKQQAEKIP